MSNDIDNKFYDLASEVIHIFKQMRINNEKVDPKILQKYFLNNAVFLKYYNNSADEQFIRATKEHLLREIKCFNKFLTLDNYDKINDLLKETNSNNFTNSLSSIFSILAKSYMEYHKSIEKMDLFFKDVLLKIANSNQKMFLMMNENVKILNSDTKKDKEILGNVKNISIYAEEDTDFETFKNKITDFTKNITKVMEEKINVKTKSTSKLENELVVLKKELEVYKKKTASLENEIIKYKEEAITDDLTDFYRKNFMFKKINEMIMFYKRKKMIFSLIIMDLDDFKNINDTYGHNQGDLVLKYFSNIVHKHIRETDFPFRYGGEEFVILLEQGSNGKDACELAKRMLKEINDTIFKIKNNKLKITASFGVAEYREGFSATDLIEEVDKNLYLAKQNGKNCIYFEDKKVEI